MDSFVNRFLGRFVHKSFRGPHPKPFRGQLREPFPGLFLGSFREQRLLSAASDACYGLEVNTLFFRDPYFEELCFPQQN